MPIKSIYVVPHGSMILDPSKEDKSYQPEIEPLNQALKTITEMLTKQSPDVIILITPHGIALSESHGIYMNAKVFGRGDTEEEEKWNEFQVSASIDLELSQKLLLHMQGKFPNRFDGITQFSTEYTAQLGWAEVVPLCNYFNDASSTKTKLVILSLSSARKTKIESLTQEAFEVGTHLQQFIEKQDRMISIVVSADLAHTHRITKGPLMGQEPYGVTKEAEQFDKNCELWARNPNNNTSLNCLLVENRQIAALALSCGYLGMIMAAGVLKAHGSHFKTQFLCRGHPTYFGMMVSYYDISTPASK